MRSTTKAILAGATLAVALSLFALRPREPAVAVDVPPPGPTPTAQATASDPPRARVTPPAAVPAAPRTKVDLTAKIASHVARDANPPVAPAPLLDSARNLERDLWPTGDQRAGLMSMFDEAAFGDLLDALEVQMAHDAGASELAQLFADNARGKLPMDRSVQLQRLACGLRICAALYDASGPGHDLPRQGYNSMSTGIPLPDGGMRHRVIFSLDPSLNIAPQPARPGG